MGAAAAPVEVAAGALEPPEPESAPVPALNNAGTPTPAERTTAAPESAPDDTGTPAPTERTTQVQGEAPGPRVAQQGTLGPRTARQEVLGPRVVRQRAPGPRWAQQGSPEAVPVHRKNLQGKDR